MTQAEFAERIVAMQGALYRVSTTLLRQMCDREDAVQTSIEKAWRAQHKLRDDNALRAWVVRILVRECYALTKKRKRELPMEQLPEREVAPDAAPELNRVLDALPEKYRLPVTLHYIEGYAVWEIAHILSRPQGTIKSQLSRGRGMLQDALRREEADV